MDRLKGPLRGFARAADPLARYRCMYPAKLRSQSADKLRVDVEPDDKALPSMSNIPLRHGIPGLTVSVAPGAYLLVGWGGGSPTDPFAALWSNPSTAEAPNAAGVNGGIGTVLGVWLGGQLVYLGTDGVTKLIPVIDGVMTGQSIDILTGLPQFAVGNGSLHVMAKKV